MIAIVDYGLGNVQAFLNIFKRLGIPAYSAASKTELVKATKIILPGVGSFDWAMNSLHSSGMTEVLNQMVLHQAIPILGVCVGMQMMAQRSDEGQLPGLGWINAEVKKFDEISPTGVKVLLPHMGWNDVSPRDSESIFHNMETSPRFYFLHSYYFSPEEARFVLATTEYNGFTFASAVRLGNIYGVQFHPEKSHHWGITLLKNFGIL